jgi:signal transduction histidine kinase
LAGDAKICVFRFIQEALTNAIRHGGPDRTVSVRQRFQGDRLTVDVTDDGEGFDPEAVARDRLGLACLHQRVEGVGGTLEVSSSRQGTCVRMTLQIESNERPKCAA